MPASRWKTDIFEILEMFADEERDFNEMVLAMNMDDLMNNEQLIEEDQQSPTRKTDEFPEEIPILPLRGLVVFPQTAVPLTIGQPRSIRLVDEVVKTNRLVGLVASKDASVDEPSPDTLYRFGTLAIIHRLFRAPDGTIRLLVQGSSRFKIKEFTATEPFLKALVKVEPEKVESGLKIEALARNVRDQFIQIAELVPSIPSEIVASINSLQDPLQTVYNIANLQRMEVEDAQEILELNSTSDKLRKLVGILTRESEVLNLGQKIQNEAREEIEKVQREYYLREQLKAIQKELGESDEQEVEVSEFRIKIDKAGMSEEADKMARRELDRLSRLPTAAAEYGVIRTYLDWLVSLPWSKASVDDLNINHAKEVLDRDHYGLDDIKERILEYLAVRKIRLQRKDDLSKQDYKDSIRQEREGVILCFVGPPGVGKTSLGKSIAAAMGREFIRTSLGGLRDEAEIRGHRRTYIGAMPGRIIQALRRVETRNPIFMLDEIDKLASDFRGDPASALLEVLDPEQNVEFRDNYLEVAFDLSQVMFITTANQLETIPAPLRDRMEIIQISGYTDNEKVKIAENYLIPRQLQENGLLQDEVIFEEDAIRTIIRQYTRESGVRNLERTIGSVLRKIVTRKFQKKRLIKKVTVKHVHEMLGRPTFMPSEEIMKRTSIPGVATGLAWTPTGGEILFIEASQMPGNKQFKITGSIGNVMEESAIAALTFVRSHAKEYGIEPDFFEKTDIHLHIPAGATPKDGPSAGVTMTTALVSLLTKKPIRPDVGMTGEITLRGQVLPVGGIKEKMLAAHRAGLKTIFLPKENKGDLDELPEEVRKSIQFIPVDDVSQILKKAMVSEE
ncbi:MAG: Lon protease [Anaerolinea thermophila]|uniref:Lon protease n=1 Tax=Anaerolinea thermophila TaxID=167964 RepID=A0A101FXI5_9CHLR|nr:MAG: Lon protease [Anaerolinea thermophila]